MRHELRRHDWSKGNELARPTPIRQADRSTQGSLYDVVTIPNCINAT